ncbi:gp39 [Bacillus phage W.Ph.]|uniref:Gp39 n=1 Tax=Bacillus phage W.Ph. TaxID=764595 RepID=G9B1E0_9CAUD|nr:gp39 [Bacillus phage W.Ph.]ADH03185.1 gp39 [Bacillus phage W.Ph.]
MSFVKYLHPLWKSMLSKVNDSHTAVVTSIDDAFTQAEKDAMELVKDANLETASGEWLDEYGNIFGVFRKDNEKDDDYRRRIINWILTERGTVGSIKDAIEKWLDDPEAEVEIYEPFKNVFFLNKSKLNGPDHLLGRYYTSAVIDIRFTKHVPVEIIDEIRKFKAAGVTAKLTRLPNRNNKSYTIQELKILKDRNFAVGSDISLEAWKPAGTGKIPTYAEKTSEIKPRTAFDARATTSVRSTVLTYESTSRTVIYNNTGDPDKTQSTFLTMDPDAAKNIGKRMIRIGFNLVKNVTAVVPNTIPPNRQYYVGVETKITYEDGTSVWVNVRDNTTPVGVISKLPNFNYSNTYVYRDYQLDPNKEVKEVVVYTGARGFTGTVEFRGVIFDVFNEMPNSLESPVISNTPANPIKTPLGGVPQDGKIGGINVLNNPNMIKYVPTGGENQTTDIGAFKFGDSSGVEGNRITIYYDYEFIPKTAGATVNGTLRIQGANPYPAFYSHKIDNDHLKGSVITTPNFAMQPVRMTKINMRCDNLDGTLIVTNFKLVVGDYGRGNVYLAYSQDVIDRYTSNDGKTVDSTAYQLKGFAPSQVMQFDLFKAFEDRFGKNFFANTPSVPDKIEYVRSMMRNVRIDIKVKSSLVESPTEGQDKAQLAYYSVLKWHAEKRIWDTNNAIRVSKTAEELQNAITVTTDDLSNFICPDGYVYIAITGSTNTQGGSTLTQLSVDSFVPKIEFKRGTTILTHTSSATYPEPVISNWTPLPTDEYDNFSSTDDKKYVRLNADKNSNPRTPPQFLIAYYIPDVIAESIGEHVFRGVEDQYGRIQIARNLVSDIGLTIKARGLQVINGKRTTGFETARYNNSTKQWVKMRVMSDSPNEGFDTYNKPITISRSEQKDYISPDGYMYFALRGRVYEEGATECYIDLNYSELRLGLSLPDPSTLPLGSVRNLLLWTKDWGKAYGTTETDKGANVWHNNQCIITDRTYNEGNIAYTTANWGSLRYKTWTLKDRDVIKVGDKVVLSVDARIPELSANATREITFYWTGAANNGVIAGNITKDWSRVYMETTVTPTMLAYSSAARFEVADLPAGGKFEFANYMLIKIPTDNPNRPYEQAPEEYLFAPNSGNLSATYSISEDLKEFVGYPITISVDVEVENGVNINLTNGSSRLGTELNYQPDGESIRYMGSWVRVRTSNSLKQRLSTTYTLTSSNYKKINAGIYIQAFGDHLRVSRPSVYIGDNVDIPWSPAPEDRGEDTNIYDIQNFMKSLLKNKDRTYFALVDNDIIGYKRLEKLIPVIEVDPNAPKERPILKFAGKDWYMIPFDQVRAEGVEHVYLSANIKGGMLDNVGYSGVYLRENVRLTDPNKTHQDTHTTSEVIPTSGVTRIAEYLESANYNRIIRSNADNYVPYSQDETFTLSNIDKGSRLSQVTYSQKDGYAELLCQEMTDPFIQFGSYLGSNNDFKSGDEVRLSVDMWSPNGAKAALKLFFKVNGKWVQRQQNFELTEKRTRYEFVDTVPDNCIETMVRISFRVGADSVGKILNFKNVMLHNKGKDIPYIEGNNLQQRIDELDIVHESMIKIVHVQ